MRRLSIIIPTFNEGKTIHQILDKVKAVQLPIGLDKEVIIVNDFSIDNTEDVVYQYQQKNTGISILYFKHPFNKGKGAALHTGSEKASGDFIIIQDADLEYDPQEYCLLLQPILD